MNFKIANNHLIACVSTNAGQKACVVDTGSPSTFFFDDGVTEYTLDGRTHAITPSPLLQMARAQRTSIEGLTGTRVDGFIGMDSMGRFQNMQIDFPGHEIRFDSPLPAGVGATRMRSFMGLPIFEVSFMGKTMEAAFDSGAMHSFVTTRTAATLGLGMPKGTLHDFNPILGTFAATMYEATVAVGGTDLGTNTIAVSETYDEVLALLGVKAFVGLSSLSRNRVVLSFASGSVYVY